MGINIGAYWIYGFPMYDLGVYTYDNTRRVSEFVINGQVYPSPYMALDAVRKVIPYQNYDDPTRVKAMTRGSEHMLYCEREAAIDRLNHTPEQEWLDKCKEQLHAVLEKLGVEKKEPTLFFLVDVVTE